MLQKVVYTCVIIALHCSTRIQTAERQPTTLEIYNYTCFKNTERIKIIECEFQKFAISKYGTSVRMMFDRDLDKSFRVRIAADIVPKNSKRSVRVLDINLNVCSILQQLTNNLLLKSILAEFKRTTNLPTSCRFKGNTLYRQDNFTVSGDFVPSSAPNLNFTFTIDLFERNKLFGGWQAIGAKVN